jgi:hypothetical protein
MSTSQPASRPKGNAGSGAPFGDLAVDTLSPSMRRLVNALMLYKSMFAGPWFAGLTDEEDPETKETYKRIMDETTEQARRAFDLLQRWDGASEKGRAEDVKDQVLKRLLEDMLSLKRSSTEVFLGAGIGSPTEEMRREFLDLADIDRKHAEVLRVALGARLPKDASSLAAPIKGYAGVHAGPFAHGTLSETLRSTLDEARAAGHEPTRIVISSMALRHLRDEGSVVARQGDVFGLPVDVELSWEKDSFSITSRARVSLAEIVTQMEAGNQTAKGL